MAQEEVGFFVNDVNGKSLPVQLLAQNGIEHMTRSKIESRKEQGTAMTVSSRATHGFPGVPFEPGEPNPPTFSQGEDIIFDAFLFYDGRPVKTETFNISAIVKTSSRATQAAWVGELSSGIYTTDRDGFYEIWIPRKDTSAWYAGTYYMEIVLEEPVGIGEGRHDRRVSLVSKSFNLEYSPMSNNPETVSPLSGLPKRGTLEKTWPNSPDTIGNHIDGSGNNVSAY
jgi:hypothetical protein